MRIDDYCMFCGHDMAKVLCTKKVFWKFRFYHDAILSSKSMKSGKTVDYEFSPFEDAPWILLIEFAATVDIFQKSGKVLFCESTL